MDEIELKIANQLVATINLGSVEFREWVIRNITLPNKPLSAEQKARIKATEKEWDAERGMYQRLNGYKFYTNGTENKKLINDYDVIPDGFHEGMTIKKKEKK